MLTVPFADPTLTELLIIAGLVTGTCWKIIAPTCSALAHKLAITSNPARFDECVIASIKRKRLEHEEIMREIFASEFQERESFMVEIRNGQRDHAEKLSAHADALTAFEASLKQQGLTLSGQVQQAASALTTTLGEMQRALATISEEGRRTGKEVAELRGEVRGLWNGIDNRRTGEEDRRHRNPLAGGGALP